MAFPLEDLISEITNLSTSSRRPEREVRNLIRELTDYAFTGTLTIASVTKTIAYTKRKTLRDGNTITAIIPEARYTIALQLAADMPVDIGSEVTCTVRIDKLDGYTRTIHAYQLENEAAEGTLKRVVEQEASDISKNDDEVESNTSSSDPLEKFQNEAMATLSSDDTNVISDTSHEEELLTQLQLEAEQQLKQLTDKVTQTIHEITNVPDPPDAGISNEPLAEHTNPNPTNTPRGDEETDFEQQAEATSGKANEVSPDENDIFLDSPSANLNDDIAQKPILHDNRAPDNAVSDGDKAEQFDSPQLDVDTADTDNESTPDEPDNRTETGLEELTKDALDNSDSPVTLDLLASIVSLQTGVPTKTVSAIQKAMWTQISTPTTFGDGQSTYRFPLLGKFTVRKNLDNVSLDFVSSSIDKIADADVDDSVTYEEAQQLVEADTGPLIARHVVPLALTTATSLGMSQAKTYLTIYRTILLFLRIMAKGERRIRIDEVGEFFPSILSGQEAYRFRAYPSLLRATSSAFKDSIAFLSTTGEAQNQFDAASQDRKVQGEPETQDSSSVLKGCLTILAIVFCLIVLALMS